MKPTTKTLQDIGRLALQASLKTRCKQSSLAIKAMQLVQQDRAKALAKAKELSIRRVK